MIGVRSISIFNGLTFLSEGSHVYKQPVEGGAAQYEKDSVVTLHDGKCEWTCKVPGWCNQNAHAYFLPDGTAHTQAWTMTKGEGESLCSEREAPSGDVPLYVRPTADKPTTLVYGDRVQLSDGKCQWDCIEPGWCNLVSPDDDAYVLPGGRAVASAWTQVLGEDLDICRTGDAAAGGDEEEEETPSEGLAVAQPCDVDENCAEGNFCCPNWHVCIADTFKFSEICTKSCGGACDVLGEKGLGNAEHEYFKTGMKHSEWTELVKGSADDKKKAITQAFDWISENNHTWKATAGKCPDVGGEVPEEGLNCDPEVINCKSCIPDAPKKCMECMRGFEDDCGKCIPVIAASL